MSLEQAAGDVRRPDDCHQIDMGFLNRRLPLQRWGPMSGNSDCARRFTARTGSHTGLSFDRPAASE